MISAWFNAFLGTALIVLFGNLVLGLTPLEEATCVLASNTAGLFALFVYTAATRSPWSRRHVVNGPGRTWLMFLTVYFGPMLAMAEPLRRNGTSFLWLVVPMMLTTGFAILVFGPIQDTLVSRGKRH